MDSTHQAAAELPALPEPLEIDWPQLHSSALGCGVEDRNIRDRYEAAEYGWQDGVDKAAECVPDAIYDADQMRNYGSECWKAGYKHGAWAAQPAALATTGAGAGLDERAAFEAKMRGSNLMRNAVWPDDYHNDYVQAAWTAWQARAALAAQGQAERVGLTDEERFFSPEFEVWQGDDMQASASGHRANALAEAMNYASQYAQDGPVRVFEVERRLIAEIPFAADPQPNGPTGEGKV